MSNYQALTSEISIPCASPPPLAYRIGITIPFTLPSVWRRIVVPSDITLTKLHRVIQAAIGWPDAGWHHFEDARGDCYTGRGRFGLKDSARTPLASVLGGPKSRLIYHYGFEEDWEHHFELEGVSEGPRRLRRAECVAGEGGCPPEACGGPLGLRHLIESGRDSRLYRMPLPRFSPGAFELAAAAAAVRLVRL